MHACKIYDFVGVLIKDLLPVKKRNKPAEQKEK